MLSPVPAKRADGGSSFGTLQKYLTEEVDKDTGEVINRGDVMVSDALLSADTAAAEMAAVAAENPRCKDAVMHVVLAWQEGEKPTREQWSEAVKHTMKNLRDRDGRSMEDHQWMAVAHEDTDAFHVHVMANRVHPENYKANAPEWLHRTLDKSCREIENAQGWKESPGLYRWDKDAGKAVQVTADERQVKREQEGVQEPTKGKPAQMESHSNSESLETYCKGQPAKDLAQAMKRQDVTWQDVHATLHKHGLTIHQGGKGGFTVSTTGQDGKDIHVKASKVFRGQFAGKEQRAATEKALGAWEPPRQEIEHVIKQAQEYSPHREPRRDPAERADRREARAKAREDLKGRYQEYREQFYKDAKDRAPSSRAAQLRQDIAAARQREKDRLKDANRIDRQGQPGKSVLREAVKILKNEVEATRNGANAKYRLNRMAADVKHSISSAMKEREQRKGEPRLSSAERDRQIKAALADCVKARHEARRKTAELRRQEAQDRREHKPQDYETWTRDQAEKGDRAALSQVNGWHYHQQRKAANSLEEVSQEQARPGDKQRYEPEAPARVISENKVSNSELTWSIDRKTGDVTYKIGDKAAFIDSGDSVTFASKNMEAVAAGLDLARKKYGPININGSDEFKRRAVEIAVDYGIDAKFTDKRLDAHKEAYRHQISINRGRAIKETRITQDQAQARNSDKGPER